MRHTFELSDETRKVINGHASDVAEEYGCNQSYISQIMGGTETDPFAKFLWLYSACLRAGCDTAPWIVRLKMVEEKYRPLANDKACIAKETANLTKEAADVAACHITDKPLHVQLSEVSECIAQAEILKASLIKAINDEREFGNVRRFGGQ